MQNSTWPLVELDLSGVAVNDELLTGVANRYFATLRSLVVVEHVDGQLTDLSVGRVLDHCGELRSVRPAVAAVGLVDVVDAQVALRRCRNVSLAAFVAVRSAWSAFGVWGEGSRASS